MSAVDTIQIDKEYWSVIRKFFYPVQGKRQCNKIIIKKSKLFQHGALYVEYRGGSRTAATSKMERFVIIVNGFQPLTITTKRSILDVAAVLDPLLEYIINKLKRMRSHRLLIFLPFFFEKRRNYSCVTSNFPGRRGCFE